MSGTTTTEAASQLGVPKSTLHTWLQQLPIPHDTDSRGRKSFDADALAVLEAVKSLRGEDCGYQTIRRKLEGVNDNERDSAGHVPEARETERDAYETVSRVPAQIDTVAIVEAVTAGLVPQLAATVAANNELAEKYARAAHTIGTLEERVASLTAQLGEARTLLAAPAPRPWWKLWT